MNMKKHDTKKTGNTKKSKKFNNVMFGIGCVVLGLLVILIFFLANKDQIFTNLKETDFFDNVFGTTPQVIENHEIAQNNKKEEIPLEKDSITITINQENQKLGTQEENVKHESTLESSENNTVFGNADSSNLSKEQKNNVNKNENQTTENKQETTKVENPQKKEEQAITKPSQNTDLQLCFILIDGDGRVVRKMIKRTVQKNDSPLTNAINLLLKGPDLTKASEKDCMSVIPKDTKLLSAKVQNGIAYLNFNEALEINEFGVEGIIHSLEQIVYTATSFSTVNSVQFLIDGKNRKYIGSEGQRIDSPLSRENF